MTQQRVMLESRKTASPSSVSEVGKRLCVVQGGAQFPPFPEGTEVTVPQWSVPCAMKGLVRAQHSGLWWPPALCDC